MQNLPPILFSIYLLFGTVLYLNKCNKIYKEDGGIQNTINKLGSYIPIIIIGVVFVIFYPIIYLLHLLGFLE